MRKSAALTDAVIAHLQQEDPIPTQSSNVRVFVHYLLGWVSITVSLNQVFGESTDDGGFASALSEGGDGLSCP